MMESSRKDEKPITAVFTSLRLEHNLVPYARLQQLDAVGIHKVYLLVSSAELEVANHEKFSEIDENPSDILEHYKSYLSKNKANIVFEVINTGEIFTDKEKILFFLENCPDDNLLNLCFCDDQKLPWLSEELRSTPDNIPVTTTTFHAGSRALFSKAKLQLPSLNERLTPEIANELLNREVNPTFCYPRDQFDIVNCQALFKSMVEIFAIKLQNDDSPAAKTARHQISKFIKQYGEALSNLEKAEEAFENSHKKMYRGEPTVNHNPSKVLQATHARNIQKKEDAREAFPKLIRDMMAVYREYSQQPSQKMEKRFK